MNLDASQKILINVGCGINFTPGWINLDNSFSVRIAKYKFLVFMLHKLGFLSGSSKRFIKVCRDNKILYSNCTKNIPFSNASVDVIYSSHMLEHLDPNEVISFLQETRRVLRSNGIIRLVVPDLKKLVKNYITNEDADEFIGKLLLTKPETKTRNEKIKFLLFGNRLHKWMYDGKSMVHLLKSNGFKNVQVLSPGKP